MKSITIAATKNTNEKTFTVGETYIYVNYNWSVLRIIDITDKHIIFQNILTGDINKSTKIQFDKITSRIRRIEEDTAGRRGAFEDLFENSFKWFKSYYMS